MIDSNVSITCNLMHSTWKTRPVVCQSQLTLACGTTVPLPNSAFSDFKILALITYGVCIYMMELGQRYISGLFFHRELVINHLSPAHNGVIYFTPTDTIITITMLSSSKVYL